VRRKIGDQRRRQLFHGDAEGFRTFTKGLHLRLSEFELELRHEGSLAHSLRRASALLHSSAGEEIERRHCFEVRLSAVPDDMTGLLARAVGTKVGPPKLPAFHRWSSASSASAQSPSPALARASSSSEAAPSRVQSLPTLLHVMDDRFEPRQVVFALECSTQLRKVRANAR
jgi:hypothetical protein